MVRTLIGLSVGSGLEGVDAAAVRADGLGLGLALRVVAAPRVAFPPGVRDAFRAAHGAPAPLAPEVVRTAAETLVFAARQALTRAAVSPRDAFAIGFLEPTRPAAPVAVRWAEVAERVAEQTGVTVLHGFADRDRAAGGAGRPVTAVADYILFRDPTESRLLVHLGAVSQVFLLPAGGTIPTAFGGEPGPGNQLLDQILFHGTKGREFSDLGGKHAVQGRCLEPLLARWADHPHLTRALPKTVHPEAFGRSFLLAAFESARLLGGGLPDLLCTATHLAARAIGAACRAPHMRPDGPRRVLLTGGGVRNGFLWQLVAKQFAGSVERADAAGVPALARNAAAAAVLAALTCDGVPGNLPLLTGAAGGRLLGQISPGDGRNWARCSAWLADQTGDYPRANRAA
ncbi:anhydro-N-acetylmuramic acid kinase [Gemmata sp. JC673]|uniref:Anhydro-N-acetylmuramic acid kinase n=1 Tax=Gemmata algarum TaxID=2975278 RepID=A0ABU5EXH6_9BACT|nr:anhydro-N-acetylmuramic acid kinase [Gemmata algarum]MDY3559643.1 anhydro-N-acetylmuramic acid kinase [Gemmata algarum]